MTIAAVPGSASFGRDLVFALPLIAAGIGCVVLLALSDARGPLTVFIAAVSLVAVAIALGRLAASKSLSTHTRPGLRRICSITEALTNVIVPLFTGLALRDPQAMDVTSLGTYALLPALPRALRSSSRAI